MCCKIHKVTRCDTQIRRSTLTTETNSSHCAFRIPLHRNQFGAFRCVEALCWAGNIWAPWKCHELLSFIPIRTLILLICRTSVLWFLHRIQPMCSLFDLCRAASPNVCPALSAWRKKGKPLVIRISNSCPYGTGQLWAVAFDCTWACPQKPFLKTWENIGYNGYKNIHDLRGFHEAGQQPLSSCTALSPISMKLWWFVFGDGFEKVQIQPECLELCSSRPHFEITSCFMCSTR